MKQKCNGLTFSKFKQTLEKMKDISDAEDTINKLCIDLNRKHKECSQTGHLPDMASDVVYLLEIILDDKAGWISYWVWEKDFGRREDLKAYEQDDTEIPLNTIEDLWTLLTEI